MTDATNLEGVLPQIEGWAPKIFDKFKVLNKLMKDRSVPLSAKAVPALAVGAAIWLSKHEGLIPDSVPVVGKLDNWTLAAGAIWVGMEVFELVAPHLAVARAWEEVNKERKEREMVVGAAKRGGPPGGSEAESRWKVKS